MENPELINFPTWFIEQLKDQENASKSGWNEQKKKWYPYKSVEGGTPTVAYGIKESFYGEYKAGITQNEADSLLKSRLTKAYNDARKVFDSKYGEGSFDKCSLESRLVSTDLTFNLGASRFSQFKKYMNGMHRDDINTMETESRTLCTTPKGERQEMTRRNRFREEILRKEADTSQSTGGVYFDKAALLVGSSKPIKGVTYDSQSGDLLLFLGDDKTETKKVKLLDKFFAEDIATIFKMLYNNGHSIGFSLDPANPLDPSGPFQRKLYFPPELKRTSVGHSLWLADWKLKQLSLGVDYNDNLETYTDITDSVRKSVPAYMSTLEIRANSKTSAETGYSRLWFVIDHADIEEGVVGGSRSIMIRSIQLKVCAKRMMLDIFSRSGLRDVDTPANHPSAKFAEILNSHMDEFIRLYPEFARLQQIATIVTIVTWLRDVVQVPAEFINWGSFHGKCREYREDYQEGKVPRLHNEKVVVEESKDGKQTYKFNTIGGVSLSVPLSKIPLSETSKNIIIKMLAVSFLKEKIKQPSLMHEEKLHIVPTSLLLPGKCFICKCEVTVNPTMRSFNGKEGVQAWIQHYTRNTYNGDIFCLAHHPKRCASSVCEKKIICYEQYLTIYDGRMYHPECFCCGKCKDCINEKCFAVEKGIFFHTWCVDKMSSAELKNLVIAKDEEMNKEIDEDESRDEKILNSTVAKVLLEAGLDKETVLKKIKSLMAKKILEGKK